MSQISPPIRILLVCAVAFLAAWMLFLRPKSEDTTEPPVPAPNIQTDESAVSQPGQIVESVQQAADAANARNEAVAGEAETTATAGSTAKKDKGATGAGAVPADLKGVPKPVARAIRKNKAVVLLFWNDKSADDRAVRDALKNVDRWDGRVFVHAAPIKSISRYGRITRGADVEQSPTVIVVDPELRAETVVGYVDARTINQMVVDAFRNSTGLFTSVYLRDIDRLCARYSNALWSIPAPDNRREFASYVGSARGKWQRFASEFNGIAAPKKWRSLKRATVRDNAAAADVLVQWNAYLGANPTPSRIVSSVTRYGPQLNEIGRRYNRRMNDEHVLSCGSNS